MIYFLTLGINGIRNAFTVLNMLLPESLQGDKITGHSGRNTLVTAAVNSGIDATVVALTSKHKDPKSIMGYIEPNVNTAMTASMAIGLIGSGNTSAAALLSDKNFESGDRSYAVKNRLHRKRVILEEEENVEISQDFPISQQTDAPALKVVKSNPSTTSTPPACNIVYNFYNGHCAAV